MKLANGLVAVIALVLVVMTKTSEISAFAPPCPKALSVVLTDPEVFENGSMRSNGHLFPPERVWRNDTLVFGCPCSEDDGSKCIRTCCKPGELLDGSTCISLENFTGTETRSTQLLRPLDKNLAEDIRWIKNLEDLFYTIPNNLCPGDARYNLDPKNYPEDEFVLQANGLLVTKGEVFVQQRYCIGSSIEDQEIVVIACFPFRGKVHMPKPVSYPIGMISSLPFLIATLVVYAVIEELRNIYGLSLMSYLACLICGYVGLAIAQIDHYGDMPLTPCILLAFTIHFSFLSSFFWLNVMCFDIWWTFGGFRSLQGSIKQRERKKFLMYSIYAWGCASLLTAVCIIMDFAPGIPDSVLKPEFGVSSCWFKTENAKALYFYGPMGVTVVCNIVLFISTAAKIIRHKKDTAHHLKGSDSKRHDDNKQWFNLYLKLFIVMGINWSMEIISWLCQGPKYLWYLTDIANSLQGVIIFIIFVWKEKIKRLLMKRFGCKGPNFLSRDSTKTYVSTASRTCTTSVPLQEKNNFTSIDPNSASASHAAAASRIKTLSDDSDGV